MVVNFHHSFVIGVAKDAHFDCSVEKLEDRLIEEASSLIRDVRLSGGFNWAEHNFKRKPDFKVWEKVLTQTELDNLLS